ncbi:MAG: flagellar hook-associated protein FlgL [Desulfobacterales bacterium]
MRITQNMMSSIFVRSLQKQAEGLLQRQEQLATQKRINRPSDDPIGIGRVLNGRSMLSAIDQYTENIRQGKTRLEMTDQTLAMVGDLVKQARRIAEEESGAEISSAEREFAAGQIKEIYDQILQLANSKHGGRYMFAGNLTDTVPFTRASDYTPEDYHGDSGSFRIPIAEQAEVAVDADGRNFFKSQTGGVDIFSALKGLIDGFEAGDPAAGTDQIRSAVDPLQAAEVHLMNKRSELGPKLYRFQATEEHWAVFKARMQDAIGRDEDVDVVQVALELNNLKTAYETSMAAAAKIIQPSLVDFLR